MPETGAAARLWMPKPAATSKDLRITEVLVRIKYVAAVSTTTGHAETSPRRAGGGATYTECGIVDPVDTVSMTLGKMVPKTTR